MKKKGAITQETEEALAVQGLDNPGGNGGNGHGKGPGFGAWGDNGPIQDLLKSAEIPSITREFLHAGKDVEDMLGRAFFETKEEAQTWDLILAWCEEFDCEDGRKFVKRVVSSYNSVGGYSRDQALQLGTQTLHDFTYPGVKAPKDKKTFKDKGDTEES